MCELESSHTKRALLPRGLPSDGCPVGGKSSSEALASKGIRTFCRGTAGAVGGNWEMWQ